MSNQYSCWIAVAVAAVVGTGCSTRAVMRIVPQPFIAAIASVTLLVLREFGDGLPPPDGSAPDAGSAAADSDAPIKSSPGPSAPSPGRRANRASRPLPRRRSRWRYAPGPVPVPCRNPG